MTNIDDITHQTVADTFRRIFIRNVGVGLGRINYNDLEHKTDIPKRTLKSYRESGTMPNMTNFFALFSVFGPGDLSEMLGVIGMGGVENIKPAAHSEPMMAVADMINVTNEITERLRDGVFDTADKAQTAPMLLNLAHVIEEEAKAMLADVPK